MTDLSEVEPLSLAEERDLIELRKEGGDFVTFDGTVIDRLLATTYWLRGPEGLYATLRHEQHTRCAYRTRHGDGLPCDCKFGRGQVPDEVVRSEMTGCPELRRALTALESLYPGIEGRA